MSKEISYLPDQPVFPGETLRETLDTIGMSQTDLAKRMGRPIKTINEIVRGKAAITADTALQLEKIFGISSQFWLNLEANYQMALARQKAKKAIAAETKWLHRFPYREMAKIGWVKNTRDAIEKVKELHRFFGVVSFTNLSFVNGINYRKSASKKASKEALTAWMRQGEVQAQGIETQKYTKTRFLAALAEAKELISKERSDFCEDLVRICAEAGVALTFAPHLPQTYVNGATQWLTPTKAHIHLSIRNRWADIFWFTFFHEAAHIFLHSKKETFIDIDSQTRSHLEKEADDFASNFLLDSDAVLETFSGVVTEPDVRTFAREQGVSPGIVVGRLQHLELIGYNKLNNLKVKLVWPNELEQHEAS